MAQYPAPYHPLTDRQQTAWVAVYEAVLSEAPEELRHLFEYYENLIAMKIVENIEVPRLRDTHLATSRKYAKAWMATLLEQGWLGQWLAGNVASATDSLADVSEKTNTTASVGL